MSERMTDEFSQIDPFAVDDPFAVEQAVEPAPETTQEFVDELERVMPGERVEMNEENIREALEEPRPAEEEIDMSEDVDPADFPTDPPAEEESEPNELRTPADIAEAMDAVSEEEDDEEEYEVVPPEPVRTESIEQIAVTAQENTVACRLERRMFNASRKFTSAQLRQTADAFNANEKTVGGTKKIIDITNEHVAAVQSVLSRAYAYWKAVTVPFPEMGIRLLRRDQIQRFEEQMEEYRQELENKKATLQAHYQDVITAARNDLGTLFNEADYPQNIAEAYGIDWSYPPVEPPNWMKELHPEIYEAQMKAMAAQFESAIAETEKTFAEEFAKIVEHLASRLGKDEESGEYLSFGDSYIKKVTDFIERFNTLNFGGNQSLSDLVERAKGLVEGKTAKEIKKDVTLRDDLQRSLAGLRNEMDGLIVSTTRKISLTDDE